MVATDRVFAGSIPEIYDKLLVPLIFDPYAADIAERLVKLNPRSVLETAAGTGALTRAMATRLAAGAEITATDLNQPMLERARERTPDDKRIKWQQADALALPFDDNMFDAAVCQFGVMFFPDKVKGYKETRRVLKPGSTFLFSAWDRIAENAFALAIFSFAYCVFACANITGSATALNGAETKATRRSGVSELRYFLGKNLHGDGTKMEASLRSSTNFNDRSDYSVALMYLGRSKEAVELL